MSHWDVVAVVIGPVLAIFMSHVFAEEVGTRVALGRPLTRTERDVVIADESRFLWVATPPWSS